MYASHYISQPRWFSEVSGRTLSLGLKGGVRVELGGVRVVVAIYYLAARFSPARNVRLILDRSSNQVSKETPF